MSVVDNGSKKAISMDFVQMTLSLTLKEYFHTEFPEHVSVIKVDKRNSRKTC